MNGRTGPQAASLFDTPIIVDQVPDAAKLNAELKQLILDRKASNPGVDISNVGGWHSDLQMLEWGGDAAHRLLERLITVVDQFTIDVRSTGEPRYKWFPEMWANVSPRGASNQSHTHPGAFWSAVYYVDDGYGGSTEDSIGGELVLLDPRFPMIRMNTPDLRFQRPGQKPDDHEKWFRPISGLLVVFPSWLSHSVRPYNGTANRISIAINLSAVPLSVAQS